MESESPALRASSATQQGVTTLTPRGARKRAPRSGWRVGQVLRASVLEYKNDKNALLEIEGKRALAQTPTRLPVGTRLVVRIKSLAPTAIFEILEQYIIDNAPVRNAARSVLPKQTPLPALLANVAYLATLDIAPSAPLPPELIQAARQLVAAIPHETRLEFADAMRDAIDSSGLFLESRLGRDRHQKSDPGAKHDFKAGLLRLQQTVEKLQLTRGASRRNAAPSRRLDYPPLRDAPPQAQPRAAASIRAATSNSSALTELKGQLDGALARLQLMQLSVHPADNATPYWLFELPVRSHHHVDLWQLRVERDGTDGQHPIWTATLSFSLGEQGAVYARVALRANRVSTQFWAENPNTVALYSREIGELVALFRANGFRIGSLGCQVGEPHATPQTQHSFLDLRA